MGSGRAEAANEQLDRSVQVISVKEKKNTAFLIAHIAEIARRNYHLELGYKNIFEYFLRGSQEAFFAFREKTSLPECKPSEEDARPAPGGTHVPDLFEPATEDRYNFRFSAGKKRRRRILARARAGRRKARWCGELARAMRK